MRFNNRDAVEAYSPMRQRGVDNLTNTSRDTATDHRGPCRRFTALLFPILNPTLTRGATCFHRFAVIIFTLFLLKGTPCENAV